MTPRTAGCDWCDDDDEGAERVGARGRPGRCVEVYTEVLGCELRTDVEVWSGARMVEVVPPGSSVSLVLLPLDGQIPIPIRLGTSDARQAHDRIRGAGVTLHDDELVRLEGVPPMFSSTDPHGNGLVDLQDADGGGGR